MRLPRIATCLALLLAASVSAAVPAVASPAVSQPDVAASTWILADLDTGAILGSQGAHTQRPPASVLKTLALLTLTQRLTPDQTYTTTADDVTVDGSRVGIVENAPYTVRDLMMGLMMQSGNDCAHALAMLNGGIDKTVEEMNAEAQRVQAYDTVAKTVEGLHVDGQVTSAYDLALFFREGLKRADYNEYVSTINYDMPGYLPSEPGGTRQTFVIATQNPLLINDYPGAFAGKTGWTDEAGRTFVGAAEQNGHRLVVVLMNVQDEIINVAAPLLDWGFANYDSITPKDYLVEPVSAMGDTGAPAASGSASPAPAGNTSPPPAAGSDKSSTTSAAAPSGGSSGWLWGLIAVAGLGIALLILGIQQWRKPMPQSGSAGRHRR